MIRISLSELDTFRIVCKACGKIAVEVPAEKLNVALGPSGDCRFCGARILGNAGGNPLTGLRSVLDALERLRDVLDVQADVPEPPS